MCAFSLICSDPCRGRTAWWRNRRRSLASQLLSDADANKAKSGIEIELVSVSVRDIAKEHDFPNEFATDALEDVVDDPRVDLIVELRGGIDPARSLLIRSGWTGLQTARPKS